MLRVSLSIFTNGINIARNKSDGASVQTERSIIDIYATHFT